MLEYNEITPKKIILIDGEPYEVVDNQVSRKQQRKPVNQVKLRNVLSGRVTEMAFHVSDKAEEADITTKSVKYLYTTKGQWWFCAENNPADRFTLAEETIGPAGQFLKQNSVIDAVVFDDKIISVRIPIKVELTVKEAPPAVRGNTAQGGQKQIVLETGAVINAPLFVNEGDVVRVNTELGTYVERADAF
jgi:elongation factor P